MINIGRPGVRWLDDEWTVVTEDGSLSAHYENTILVGEDGPEILSRFHSMRKKHKRRNFCHTLRINSIQCYKRKVRSKEEIRCLRQM